MYVVISEAYYIIVLIGDEGGCGALPAMVSQHFNLVSLRAVEKFSHKSMQYAANHFSESSW